MFSSSNETRIKVLITNDHEIIRSSIRSGLAGKSDIEVIGEAGNGKELLDKLESLSPDIILLDLAMPVMDGLEALPLIKKRYPAIKVIMYCLHDDVMVIAKLMSLGASSYLTLEAGAEMIHEAILTCYVNDFFINETVRNALIRAASIDWHSYKRSDLTEKEITILAMLTTGKDTKEMADMVDLSPRTVLAIIDKIKCKTSSSSMKELIEYAKKEKIIE